MSKSSIICVDDDKQILESLQNELEEVFGESHFIEIVEHPLEAVRLFDKLLKDGFQLPVFIADYIMPVMKGDELLKEIHKKNSRTYKIMLTGQAQIQGIANAVNNAELFRILMKPWNREDLIFTVKEAVNNYKKNEYIEKQYFELKNYKRNNEMLKSYNNDISGIIQHNKVVFNAIIPTLINITSQYDRSYFNSQTNFIVNLSLKMAEDLQLNNEEWTAIVISSLLFCHVLQNMPDQFRTNDPNVMSQDEVRQFFFFFHNQVDRLSEIAQLNKYILFISRVWEHFDGSGLPKRLSGAKVEKISQILYLAFIYHINVYKLPQDPNLLKGLDKVVEQDVDKTTQRHIKAINYIFKNSLWFDFDIVESFKKIIKLKSVNDILVEKFQFKVFFNGDDVRVERTPIKGYQYEGFQDFILPPEVYFEEANSTKKKNTDELIKPINCIEAFLRIDELEPGMISAMDITTKYGRLVVQERVKITQDDIDELRKVQMYGLIPFDFTCKVYIETILE